MSIVRIIMGLIALAVAVGLNVYIWRRLVADPQWSPRVKRVLSGVLVIMGLMMVALMMLSRHIDREVVWPLPLLTWTWLGVLFYLLFFSAVHDLGQILRRLWGRLQPGESPEGPLPRVR